MRYSENKPPLEVQSTLFDELKMRWGPKWLYVSGPAEEKNPYSVVQMPCPVCDAQKTLTAFTPKTFNLKDLSYNVVRLHAVMFKVKDGNRQTVETYWGGQCDKCSVIFWSYRPGPVSPTGLVLP
jgi:hypothetical protein